MTRQGSDEIAANRESLSLVARVRPPRPEDIAPKVEAYRKWLEAKKAGKLPAWEWVRPA